MLEDCDIRHIQEIVNSYLDMVKYVRENPSHHNSYLASKMGYCSRLLSGLESDLLIIVKQQNEKGE